jgi:putative transposase
MRRKLHVLIQFEVCDRHSHRQGFGLFWNWKIRRGRPGRPTVPKEIRELIRTMSRENPLWGAPHIHGELLKLGVDVGETSVSKYMVSHRKPPSQTWRTFLDNHSTTLVSVDFLTVPTIRFQLLYVFLVLAHERRRIVHLAVTPHPTAEWTAQPLREAFPWETAPRYLLRDRDRIFGQDFVAQGKAMGITQVLSAPRSPWQRAYVERVIGTIRRECLDHMIVFHERSLYRYLQEFLKYYHQNRTHLALEKDSPEPRPVQPPKSGRIVSIPVLGGLHHRLRTARSIRPAVLMIHLSGLSVDKPAILRWPITDVVKDSSSTDPQSTLSSRRTPTPNVRSR